MNDKLTLNQKIETIIWGALLIWWGVVELVTSLPAGMTVIGIGLILLAANAARAYYGIAINRFSTTLGILALVWGGLDLASVLLSLPFELPVFAILLIVLGVIMLASELAGNKSRAFEA